MMQSYDKLCATVWVCLTILGVALIVGITLDSIYGKGH